MAASNGLGSITRDSLRLATLYEAPAGKLESAIATVFAEVFELDRIGANDDFFELGGDSLIAETLSLLIAHRSGRDFQLSNLMEHGSPRKIAALLERGRTDRLRGQLSSIARGRPVRQLVMLDPGVPKPTRSKQYNKGSEWPPRLTPSEKLRKRLRSLLRLRPERRTPRQRKAFANDEAEFLRRLEEKAREGQGRYPDLQLSARAQARLQASYRRYLPPPFHGPAAILSSAARDATFRDEGQIWSEFVPSRTVHRIAETHKDIGDAATARMMQSIFDAALAEDRAVEAP